MFGNKPNGIIFNPYKTNTGLKTVSVFVKKIAMLKLAQTLLLSIICFAANAQTHHFIYIENTNKQPFTAQLNGNTYEATNKDFIIIPKLARGTYNISISTLIASNKKFTINIDENDLGFSLKQNTNSELVLFDINQFTTIQQDAKYELETVKKNEEKTKQPTVDSPIKTLPIEVAIEPEKKILLQPIKKIYQKQKKDGIDEVYVDISNKKVDTISIFIP